MSEVLQEFVEITGASSNEVATYYLEQADQNIDEAIELYFEENRPAKSAPKPLLVPVSKKDVTKVKPADKPPNQMSVLQWNIEGVLTTRWRERAMGTIEEIKKLKPDVIMLQEVLSPTTPLYESSFVRDYKIYFPCDFSNAPDTSSFFTTLMVRKSSFKDVDEATLHNFGSSSQDRDITIVSGVCCGKKVTVMTSHLDHSKLSSSLRIKKFIKILERMKKEPPLNSVIFGGDTNFRDREVVKVKSRSEILAKDVDDVWEMLGSPSDCRFTWDCVRNDNGLKGLRARLRFDRVYMRKEVDGEARFKPISMKLVGTKRLPCGMFPSDHWGLFVTFELQQKEQTKKES